MADKKITQLNPLLADDVAEQDVVPVADISANETRKVTVPDLASAGIRMMPNNSIPGSKIENESITSAQLGKHSVHGGPNGEIALDTITADNIAAEAIGSSELADGAVDTGAIQDEAVTGAKLDPNSFDRGIDIKDDKVGITNDITPGTQAGITWNQQGLITGSSDPIPPADLPVATETTIGAVSVPTTGGLAVTGTGAISIDNTVTAATNTKITYDSHGLVTAGAPLEATDLPLATETTPGAVIVPAVDADGPTALDIAGDGSLTHAPSGVNGGTFPKVTVDKYGHVIAGLALEASDIPDLSFDQITSGEIGIGVLGECAVEAPNICDYATCLMQEDNPGAGDFLGQFWYTPSTAQLRVYARGSGPENIWLPVGFGALQANNLRWLGTYDAANDKVVVVTAIGVSEGISSGQPFPAPTDQLSGGYFLCQTAGNSMTQPNLNGISHDAGDWALCVNEAEGWIHIDAAAAGGGGGGGGARYLNDLLDVEIGGTAGPFSTAPAMTLSDKQIFKYDGGEGMWRNTDLLDGGTF